MSGPVRFAPAIDRDGPGPWTEGRAVDLGEGGVGIGAVAEQALPPVGTAVRCELPLGDDRITVGATVAWVRPAETAGETPAVLGLAFARREVDARVRDAVRAAPPLTCPVTVSFAGRSEPVSARAETTSTGLRLSAELPILSKQQAVQVRFAGAAARPELDGRVAAVSLDHVDDTPRVRVELALGEAAAAQAAAFEALQTTLPADPLPRAGSVRSSPWWYGALVGVGLGAAVGCAATLAWLAGPGTNLAGPGTDLAGPAGTPTQAATPPAGDPDGAQPPADSPSDNATPAASTVADAGPADAGRTDPDAATAVQPGRDAQLAVPAPDTADAYAIDLRGSRDETIITVPFSGTMEGHRTYPLTPPGVVVELPQASTELAAGSHITRKGLLRRLRLRKRDDGLQIRVNFMGPRVQADVRVEAGKVWLRLHR